jgi:hypothetical protein
VSAVDPIVVTSTTLDEIARAISELGFRREVNELSWPELEPEQRTLRNLFRQRAVLTGNRANDDLCDLAALLILDAMVAQQLHDLRLFQKSQRPFYR